MSKESTLKAIMNYTRKQDNLSLPSKRKNKKPEKQTEKECLLWCQQNNVFCHVIEASSYDPILKRSTVSKAQVGMSDLIGNNQHGLAMFIELKAKDRRSALSEHQRSFLIEKINQNCFAVVVDSREKLDHYYSEFSQLNDHADKRKYLLSCLPKKRSGSRNKNADPFEKKYGF